MMRKVYFYDDFIKIKNFTRFSRNSNYMLREGHLAVNDYTGFVVGRNARAAVATPQRPPGLHGHFEAAEGREEQPLGI